MDIHLANQGPRLAAARALVNHDPVLRELAQTPLILSLIFQTFGNEVIGQNTTLASAETWPQRLFSTYVHKMLGRWGARAPYGEQDTIRWLVFLVRKCGSTMSAFLLWKTGRRSGWPPGSRSFFMSGLWRCWEG